MIQLILNYTAPPGEPGDKRRRQQSVLVKKSFADVDAVLDHLDRDNQSLSRHLAKEIRLGQRAGLVEEAGASLVWMIGLPRRQRYQN